MKEIRVNELGQKICDSVQKANFNNNSIDTMSAKSELLSGLQDLFSNNPNSWRTIQLYGEHSSEVGQDPNEYGRLCDEIIRILLNVNLGKPDAVHDSSYNDGSKEQFRFFSTVMPEIILVQQKRWNKISRDIWFENTMLSRTEFWEQEMKQEEK